MSLLQLRFGVLILCLVLLGFTGSGQGATMDDSGDDIPDGWRLMPRVGVSLEYGGFIAHQDNFVSQLRRQVEMDLIQYRRHIFYLAFDEKTFFGIPDNKWQFNLMKYDVILGGYRYDFGDFYLGAFIHHQCNNIMQTLTYRTSSDRERTNLYAPGLEFLTKNMRIGMKDRGINFDSPQAFEFLGRWGAGFWASNLLVRDKINVSWDIRGQARYDIFRYRNVVPYLEVSGEVLAGPVTRAVPSAEVGARWHFSRFDLIPFFKWSRDQESLIWQTNPVKTSLIAKNSLYGGARLETLLDSRTFGATPNGSGFQFLPEIHGTANYAFYLGSQLSKGHADMEVNLEALRWNSWTAFFYTDMNFSSREQDFKPDKINYWLQYGLTYSIENYFVEGFVKDVRRLDNNIFRGTMERSNLAGLRAGTKGMKPGHFNEGISFNGPVFEFINNWNAQASFGHFFNNRDWQYLWNIDAKVRWDPIRWHFIVPYIQGEINWQSGGGPTSDTVEYAVEPGLRLHGVLDFAIYYRFQHQENRLVFRGAAANESLVGVKALF
jgi:hypothetical protein